VEVQLSRRSVVWDVLREVLAARATQTGRDRLDVIAQTVAAGLRPAAAGQAPGTADPDKVRRSLAAIEHDGRAALGELREVVGGLRAPDAGPPLGSTAPLEGTAPQPTLAQLPELIRAWPAGRCPETGQYRRGRSRRRRPGARPEPGRGRR